MDVVTGAFGYIGRHIAGELLARGRQVRTITTHPSKPNPFGPAVQAHAYNFNQPEQLAASLAGAHTLYNTYWIRFPYAGQTYESALANTKILFHCARMAGVKRIVHISVTGATPDSDLPYYRGKAGQESMLRQVGVPFSIVRPTLVFGTGDILVNNIAYLLRQYPAFPIFGSGQYRVQPVYVEDLAKIAVEQSASEPDSTVDALGPQTFTFRELVQEIAQKIGRNIRLVKVPPAVGILCGKALGLYYRDVLLTRNELKGLMDEKLTSSWPPNGATRFTDWLHENKDAIGRRYASEIVRHFRWSGQ